jgi:hypothetical protein
MALFNGKCLIEITYKRDPISKRWKRTKHKIDPKFRRVFKREIQEILAYLRNLLEVSNDWLPNAHEGAILKLLTTPKLKHQPSLDGGLSKKSFNGTTYKIVIAVEERSDTKPHDLGTI